MAENKEHSSRNSNETPGEKVVSGYSDYARFMACVTAHYLDAKSRYDPMAIFLSPRLTLSRIKSTTLIVSCQRNGLTGTYDP